MRPMEGRECQWGLALSLFITGFAFFLASALWPDAMSPEVYGNAAYDISAETWALGFMGNAAAILYGVKINGRWRWSPWLRLVGWAGLAVLFGTLVVSSFTAPFGSVVVIFGAMFAVWCGLFLRSNIRDLAARR